MYSLLHKEENAHEVNIWSCAWGRTKTPSNRMDDDPDNSRDSMASDGGEQISDFIVTGGLDDIVKVWDLTDNRLQLRHQMTGHSLGVVSVAVSSDGKTIVSSSLDSSLCFWNSETGQLLNQVALGPVDLWTLDFSPCDKYVISGSHDGKISLYSVETGRSEQVLDPQNGKFTLSIAYSPDGKYIASGAIDGIINIFDVAAGKVAQTLEGHAMSVRSLCFSPDSQMLLTASDDGHMKLYDVAHSDVVGTLSGHASWVLSVSFSGDGRFFTSSSSDKSVKIWEVSNRSCLHTFRDHADQVWGVKYSPDSNRVVSVSEDRSINLYDCPKNVV
ncbi:SKI8 subunit of superkiller complex protein [Phlebotomus papatasi]|uniref:SKI8 subunit of superkiller complex protein n=1 Tax=Phlebotomus papatasi TaxID=29031 RepID=UPI0024839854|nr:SKI8 subunit of superkiller complex protein [Phlebotomus papatasi]